MTISEKGKHKVEPSDEHKAKVNTLMPIFLFKNDTLSRRRVGYQADCRRHR